MSASPSSRHCPGSLDKGATGTVVAVSATNSIVGGKTGDQVGSGGITVLANGNYVVRCEFWYNATVKYAGAATLGRGTARTFGVVSPTNSLVGLTANSKLGTIIPNPVNNAFYARFINEAGGRVRVGITIFPA